MKKKILITGSSGFLGNLAKASEILAEANKLTAQYEQELNDVRKEAQLEITNSQKIHQEILEKSYLQQMVSLSFLVLLVLGNQQHLPLL